MYMRLISCLLLALACSALLVGCKKDAQVDSVLTELDTFTKELVAKIDTAPNPSAGVDAAQKFFDSRKADLQAKLGTLKGLRGFQVSDETKKKMMASMTENVMSVGKLKIKYMSSAMRDPALNAKLDKLNADYQSLLKSMAD
jgi:outer membrane murein-binding lipoprotein Lpp